MESFDILIVDDEPAIIQSLTRLIRHASSKNGHITGCTEPLNALSKLKNKRFDAIISDYRMPSMNGIEFLSQAAQIQPHASRLIISATEDFQILLKAINQANILNFLPKPWDDQTLLSTLFKAVEISKQKREDRLFADEHRLDLKALSPQDLEIRRLEEEHPGLTHANWNEEGALILETD